MNNSVIFIWADKGNVTVALDDKMYISKVTKKESFTTVRNWFDSPKYVVKHENLRDTYFFIRALKKTVIFFRAEYPRKNKK